MLTYAARGTAMMRHTLQHRSPCRQQGVAHRYELVHKSSVAYAVTRGTECSAIKTAPSTQQKLSACTMQLTHGAAARQTCREPCVEVTLWLSSAVHNNCVWSEVKRT